MDRSAYDFLLEIPLAEVRNVDPRHQRHAHRDAVRALQAGVPEADRAPLLALVKALEEARPDLAGYHGDI